MLSGYSVQFYSSVQEQHFCASTSFICLFVCDEVLRPSQPNGFMSRAVSLPNHMFTGQA